MTSKIAAAAPTGETDATDGRLGLRGRGRDREEQKRGKHGKPEARDRRKDEALGDECSEQNETKQPRGGPRVPACGEEDGDCRNDQPRRQQARGFRQGAVSGGPACVVVLGSEEAVEEPPGELALRVRAMGTRGQPGRRHPCVFRAGDVEGGGQAAPAIAGLRSGPGSAGPAREKRRQRSPPPSTGAARRTQLPRGARRSRRRWAERERGRRRPHPAPRPLDGASAGRAGRRQIRAAGPSRAAPTSRRWRRPAGAASRGARRRERARGPATAACRRISPSRRSLPRGSGTGPRRSTALPRRRARRSRWT